MIAADRCGCSIAGPRGRAIRDSHVAAGIIRSGDGATEKFSQFPEESCAKYRVRQKTAKFAFQPPHTAISAATNHCKSTSYVARPGLALNAEIPIYFPQNVRLVPCQEKSAEIL
jgi:hypothetical protein